MAQVSKREKKVIQAGGVLVLALALIQFVWLPALDRSKALEKVLASELESWEQILSLRKTFEDLGLKDSGQPVPAPADFSLFSFLDRQAAQSGVKENVEYMKPQQRTMENSPHTLSLVKLQLNQIVFRDFIRFVSAVESADPPIRITALNLAVSGKNEQLLDVTMETQVLVSAEAQ